MFFSRTIFFWKQKGEILEFFDFLLQMQLILLLFWDKFTNFFDITKLKKKKKTLLDTFKRLNIPPSLQISCPYLLVCSNCRMKNDVQLLLVKCSRCLIHLVQYSLTQLAIWKDQQLAVSFQFSSQMKEPTRLVSQSTT